MNGETGAAVLAWYGSHARVLPWRRKPDAYTVWVSEIMLQQTRVETVIPYFERWMQRFPTLAALAAATEQDVLQVWEGLGYYSRARSLRRAAVLVMSERGGQIPPTPAGLLRLPGVGAYTAAAIASIAFGVDVPALDGNIRRVLSRFTDMRLPARSPAGEKALLAAARSLCPLNQAGDFNQALMDLGALVCTPRSPDCLHCPMAPRCAAFRLGTQAELPIRLPRRSIPHLQVVGAVIHHDGKVLIARRPSGGLLGGLWEFPGGKVEPGETSPQALEREIREELGALIQVKDSAGQYRHAYTHFRVTLNAFHCRLLEGTPYPLHASEILWVHPQELHNYPMGKIDRSISKHLLANWNTT